LNNLKTYVISTDLLVADGIPQQSKSTRNTEKWTPIFSPVEFVKNNRDISKVNFQLEDEELYNRGK